MNKFIKAFSIASIVSIYLYIIAGLIGGYLYLNTLSGLQMSLADLPFITYIALIPTLAVAIYRTIVCLVCVRSLKSNSRKIPFEIISLVLIIVFSLLSTGLSILFGSIATSYGVHSLAAYSSFLSGFNMANVVSSLSFICYMAVVFGSIIRKRIILKNAVTPAAVQNPVYQNPAYVQTSMPYESNGQQTTPYTYCEQPNNVNSDNYQDNNYQYNNNQYNN